MLQLFKCCFTGNTQQVNVDTQVFSQTQLSSERSASGAVSESRSEPLDQVQSLAKASLPRALESISKSMRSATSNALPLNRLDKRETGQLYTRLVSDTGIYYDLITRIDPKRDRATAQAVQDALKNKSCLKVETGSLILGQGAFGTVRLARNSDDQLLAVKKVEDYEVATWEVASSKLMQKVPDENHKYFVATKDIVIAQGKNGKEKAYLFQDLVPHDDLSCLDDCRSFKNLENFRRLEMAQQLVQPVAVLHKHGLAHRDIKPENYLFDRPNIKLADFGFLTEEKLNTARVGTFQYMPPEMGSVGCESAQSDNFALGVTLHELGGFRHPCNRYNFDEFYIDNRSLKSSEEFKAATNHAMQQNATSPTLETIVLHLMHPDPQNRLTAAGAYDLLQALMAKPPQQV